MGSERVKGSATKTISWKRRYSSPGAPGPSRVIFRNLSVKVVARILRRILVTLYLRASERSERSEHIVVVSSRFYYNSVTKILRKIRATTFTERLRKVTREGPGAPGMSNAASN